MGPLFGDVLLVVCGRRPWTYWSNLCDRDVSIFFFSFLFYFYFWFHVVSLTCSI